MKKIEFLTTCFAWDEGYITKVVTEDDFNYYFDDVWKRWCYIEKTKENIEFTIHEKKQRFNKT